MTTQPPRDRYVVGEVKAVSNVAGKYGPQWEIQIKYPFSNYPSKAWVSDASEDDNNRIYHPKSAAAPQPDREYPCIIRRGVKSQKRDEDETGEGYDGTLAWMYRWRMIEFDTNKTADDYPDSDSDSEVPGEGAGPPQQSAVSYQPSAPASAPQPMLAGDERQRLIVQQNILNRAVDLYIGTKAGEDAGKYTPDWTDAILDVANQLWALLPTIGQEPVPEAIGEPESDVTPPEVAEREYVPAGAPPDPVEEAEQLPWDEPPPTEGPPFASFKKFGVWARSLGLSSGEVLAIAQGIGIDIDTTMELKNHFSDERLINAVIDASQA
jgi:hypothetical protein